jgi:hypothetical protein
LFNANFKRKEANSLSVALTTVDNPFNPITQFDDWFAFDEEKGYHSCSYLARIANTSKDLTDEENETIINEAIDEIVAFNLGFYKKVDSDHTSPLEEATPRGGLS